jgi:hypothetical protein
LKRFILAFIFVLGGCGSAEPEFPPPPQSTESPSAEVPAPPIQEAANRIPADFSELTIQSLADVEAQRDTLVDIAFNGPLPDRLPDSVEILDDPTWAMPNLSSIDKVITWTENIPSIAYKFHALNHNGDLFIYHRGHGDGFVNGRATIEALVAQGFDVIAFSMPLNGLNYVQGLSDGANPHDDLWAAYENPLRFFLEPIVVALNLYAPDYQDIYGIGISGGGWTVAVMGALDPRITKVYPVAGTMPMYLREGFGMGDAEQRAPEIYDRVSYMDQYVMAPQIQFFNFHDPCCGGGDHYLAYRDHLREVAASVGNDFDVVIDYKNTTHSISDFVLQKIFLDLLSWPRSISG